MVQYTKSFTHKCAYDNLEVGTQQARRRTGRQPKIPLHYAFCKGKGKRVATFLPAHFPLARQDLGDHLGSTNKWMALTRRTGVPPLLIVPSFANSELPRTDMCLRKENNCQWLINAAHRHGGVLRE